MLCEKRSYKLIVIDQGKISTFGLTKNALHRILVCDTMKKGSVWNAFFVLSKKQNLLVLSMKQARK